jgi:flagellar FliL protein
VADEQQSGEETKKKFKAPKFSIKAVVAILPKLLLGLNLVGMLVGGYLAYMGTIGLTPEAIREMEARKYVYNEEIFQDRPVTYSLEPFTVNLADTGDQRIVQVKVTLEMLNEDGFEEVVSMGAHARDTIVTILNGKQFPELQTIQGKLFLKDEITVALNKQLKRSFIKDVYFSRFVLQ